MNKPAHNSVEGNFEEMSENHWKNMFYEYYSSESSRLANVSPWK